MKTILKLFSLFLIITLWGCTEENNTYVTNPIENLGKETIYIEGDITDTEATAKLASELGPNTDNIYVQNTTQLTTINIHSETDIRHIEFYNNESLVNINISGFKKTAELLFKQNTNRPYPANPITFTCNDIEEVSSTLELKLYYTAPGANINFNKLKTVGPDGDGFTLWAKPNHLNFPLLETVSIFSFAVVKNVITFPSLKHIDYISGPSYIEFSQLNFPVLEYCKNFDFGSNEYAQGAEVTIPNLNYCEEFKFVNAVNDSNVVNTILHQFLTVQPVSGKFVFLSTFSHFPLIPPTGQGLIDKQTLINQGNEVTTDY